MDSYIYFLKLYKKHKKGRIAADIYRSGGRLATIGLWLGKFVFFGAALMQFVSTHFAPMVVLMLSGAAMWGLSFSRARRRYFSNVPELLIDRAEHFNLNYQYLRYHFFRLEVLRDSQMHSVPQALSFLNGLLETDHSTPVWSHPLVATITGVALAVLGGAAGGWPPKYVLSVILFSVVGIYFSSMFLAMRTPKEATAKELKRFLLWLLEERNALAFTHNPSRQTA